MSVLKRLFQKQLKRLSLEELKVLTIFAKRDYLAGHKGLASETKIDAKIILHHLKSLEKKGYVVFRGAYSDEGGYKYDIIDRGRAYLVERKLIS